MTGRLVVLPTVERLKAARVAKPRAQPFVRRVPWYWACRVNGLHPHALIVALALKRKRDMGFQEPLTRGDDFLASAQLGPRARDRAVAALEAGGVVRVERRRGRLPRLWLLDERSEAAHPSPARLPPLLAD